MKNGWMLAGIFVSVMTSYSQTVELGICAGYGIGAGQQRAGTNSERNSAGEYTKYEDVYSSMGNGAKIDFDADVYINDNIAICIISGFSTLGGFKLKATSPTSTSELTVSSSYIPINAGLKVRANLGAITPYVYLAPGVVFPLVSAKTTTTNQPSGTQKNTYSPGIGFTSGIGILAMLSGAAKLKIELCPTFAHAYLTKATYESNGQTMTMHYMNNTAVLPVSTATTMYSRGQPFYSFSSFSLKAGICFGL